MNIAQRNTVSSIDHQRLHAFLARKKKPDDYTTKLRRFLREAVVVAPVRLPKDVVTMNSLVRAVTKKHGRWPTAANVSVVRLSYRDNCQTDEECVSVLSPLGINLLGARVGDVVTWTSHDGVKKDLIVDEIIYQPEAAGDLHL